MTAPRNVAASVRQRLLNRARTDQRPFDELLRYYAMERFLYRLSRSDHVERFVLKGALLLRVWDSPLQRPTMDIDLLGRTSNRAEEIEDLIRDVIGIHVDADGLDFDPASVRADRITADADYEGLRVRFEGRLGTARIHMQVDIGFGDVVFPEPVVAELPTVLGDRAPRLLCYSRESVVAEKLEAMVRHGELNSRMKDFYDIWLLSRQYEFVAGILSEAVRRTFERRDSSLSRHPAAFDPSFVEAKQVQWSAFLDRIRDEQAPKAFRDVVAELEAFLGPLLEELESEGGEGGRRWVAGKGWA
ncbi:nucleotidyl transferase AbiEii/AbiGii toxin family protein [bacterium]|nr:nucleotidyl transferase AbiEii/AbiGii toxin family protein [bacterium]MBU1674329.1 nucleotidyl transferase AbiEii/AbiGii toxin family protein [bacterium]